MTDLNARSDEPELPELRHLRALSHLEGAPAGIREQVLARAKTTLTARAEHRFAGKRRRPLILAALVLVGVPSAFAATGFDAQRLGQWFAAESTPPQLTGPGELGPAPPPPRHATPARPRAPAMPQGTAAMATATTPAPTDSVAPDPPRGRARPRAVVPTLDDSVSPAADAATDATAAVRAFPLPDEADATAGVTRAPTTLDAESRLLRRARLRLAAGDAEMALALANEHKRLFPNGQLGQERLSIERQAWGLRSRSSQR